MGAFSRLGEFSSQRYAVSALGLSVRSGTAALAVCTLIAVVLGGHLSELSYVEIIVELTLISALARILLTRLDPPRVLVVTRQQEHLRPRRTAGAIVRLVELSESQIADPGRLVADISSQARDFDACAVEVIGDLGLSGPLRSSLGWELREQHASLRFPMDGGALRQHRIHCTVRGGHAVIEISAPARSLGQRLAKRTTDVVGSALLIFAFVPLLVMLALAVKWSGPGPVLYLQDRVGKDGRIFKILKFRSMTDGSDAQLHLLLHAQHKDDRPLFKVDDDPRITPLGAVLRRYSLDELPQLFNVFAGSMSLVGPRPQRPAEVALYCGNAAQRLGVRPGMTGLWQVSGRSRLSWEEAQQLDIDYAHNWSIAEDLHILARTARAVVAGEGAQ
jgi:lipopolysaccharide/colanic/teichoic acid biosynthesis glycosyltransferase